MIQIIFTVKNWFEYKMLKSTFLVLSLLSSALAIRGPVKQRQRFEPKVTKDSAFPEELHDQVLDHFDATNPGQWNQRFWANWENYDGDGLAFLHIGGEAPASPGWLQYGAWYEWAQMHGAAMFVLEHRYMMTLLAHMLRSDIQILW